MKKPPEDHGSLNIISDVRKLIAPFSDPVLGELGSYVSEKIRFIRFRNSLKTMEKAKELLDEHDLAPSPVSLNVLVPILEYSGLEDEQSMVDKWARLLASASSGALVPPSFPKILAELTPQEVRFLDWMWKTSNFSTYIDADCKSTVTVSEARTSSLFDDSQFDLYIKNLLRLGLIQAGGVTTEHSDLEPRELQEYQKITLTLLGRYFIQACSRSF